MTNTPKQYTALVERKVGFWPLCPTTGKRTKSGQICTECGKEHPQLVPPELRHVRVNHSEAMRNPLPGVERALVRMLRGWLEYAEVTERDYESRIGDDGVLGAEWEAIGDALRGLLSGPSCRIDCGTVDGIILDAMRDAGINVDHK